MFKHLYVPTNGFCKHFSCKRTFSVIRHFWDMSKNKQTSTEVIRCSRNKLLSWEIIWSKGLECCFDIVQYLHVLRCTYTKIHESLCYVVKIYLHQCQPVLFVHIGPLFRGIRLYLAALLIEDTCDIIGSRWVWFLEFNMSCLPLGYYVTLCLPFT